MNTINISDLFVTYTDKTILLAELESNDIEYIEVKDYALFNTLHLKINGQQIPFLESLDCVELIDKVSLPRVESPLNALDLSVNQIQFLHKKYPDIAGENQIVSIKELAYNSEDIDLSNRSIITKLEAEEISNHATAMATLIGGAGNSFISGKGVAPKVKLSSTSYENILPDPTQLFYDKSIYVQNHSYGFDIANYYGIEAMAYDEHIYENQEILHVFSAGNKGDSIPKVGTYSDLGTFANLSGKIKMAKNTLLVGAHNEYGQVDARSSRGPTYDGRLKPEIVAYGKNGSSDAAAYVSGCALLLKQAYLELYGKEASSALIKSLLITSAIDIENEGIDYISGYGRLDADKAMTVLQEKKIFESIIHENETQVFSITLPPAVSELKLSMVWVDPKANLEASKALINNLDFVLKTPNKNEVLPWVLSSAMHLDSLQSSAKRKKDHLNNVEFISVKMPKEGLYLIEVRAKELQSGSQSFVLTYNYTLQNQFEWTFPSYTDPLEAGKSEIIRWRSSFKDEKGSLEIKWSDSEWNTLEREINLSKGYYQWTIPEITDIAQLRIKIRDKYYYSDTFTVNTNPNLNLAVNCDDRFILTWDALPEIIKYSLSEINLGTLKQYSIEQNNIKYFNKDEPYPQIFSIAPIFENNRKGLASYAIDINKQSSFCYISQFFARMGENESALLTLELGSLEGIEMVTFEVKEGNEFVEVNTQEKLEQVFLKCNIPLVNTGIHSFRAKITLTNGYQIYSEEASVLYTKNQDLIVFPNPTSPLKPIYIQSSNTPKILILFNIYGQIVYKEKLIGGLDEIYLPSLPQGVYILQVLENNVFFNSVKIVIHSP